MNVEVRLFATLREYLPAGSERTSVQVEVPVGASIADALTTLGVPLEAVHLLLVNGIYEPNKDRRLEDGCVLSVWPPIAGG